jgi:hypothetical protein
MRINKNILKDTVWKMDFEYEQLILYEKNAIYLLPFRSFNAIRIDTTDMPNDVKKFILINIVLKNKFGKVNKKYKTKINNSVMNRFPILHYIVMFTLNLSKNPFDLDDKIRFFRYNEENELDVNIREKIDFIFKNYK